jgi:AraC-like DNA-binding protein
MQHAEQLLRETDLSIGEIALTCGYIHQGHFAASFFREFNCSPAAFRGQNLSGLLNRTFGTKIRNFGINR